MTDWSKHVHRFAKKNNMTYKQANVSKKCKEDYKKRKTSPRRRKKTSSQTRMNYRGEAGDVRSMEAYREASERVNEPLLKDLLDRTYMSTAARNIQGQIDDMERDRPEQDFSTRRAHRETPSWFRETIRGSTVDVLGKLRTEGKISQAEYNKYLRDTINI